MSFLRKRFGSKNRWAGSGVRDDRIGGELFGGVVVTYGDQIDVGTRRRLGTVFSCLKDVKTNWERDAGLPKMVDQKSFSSR
jgi:hypothetical protein